MAKTSDILKNTALLGHAWLRRPRNSAPCAGHGLQRSGTNYLGTCLGRLGVRPLNMVIEYERDHPRHKHFRWYHDKSNIPAFLQHQFGNVLRPGDVDALNAAAKYPQDCKHIVMQKPRTLWLASACNWGLRVGWFDTRAEALDSLETLTKDYDAYYGFWHTLASSEPDRVVIHDLGTVLGDFDGFLASLDRFGIRYKVPPGFDGRIERVAHSDPDRANLITVEDVQDARKNSAAR